VSKVQFRKGGLYTLPNGGQFILLSGEEDSYSLCGAEDDAQDSLIVYRLCRDGRIYHRGTRTNWSAEDLTDTGRTAGELIKKASSTAI
jgi:hypothetical protein